MTARQAKKVIRAQARRPMYREATVDEARRKQWRANNRTTWPGNRSWRWGRWDPVREPGFAAWSIGMWRLEK